MPNESPLYQNDNYRVLADPDVLINIEGNEFIGGYRLVSNQTDITEFMTPCLPEALRLAVHWDVALNTENHLWPYKQQASMELADTNELLQ